MERISLLIDVSYKHVFVNKQLFDKDPWNIRTIVKCEWYWDNPIQGKMSVSILNLSISRYEPLIPHRLELTPRRTGVLTTGTVTR